MSKVSEAKMAQGFSDKPKTCARCVFFEADQIVHPPAFSWSEPHVELKNKRCSIGLFAVKMTSTCDKWLLDGVTGK